MYSSTLSLHAFVLLIASTLPLRCPSSCHSTPSSARLLCHCRKRPRTIPKLRDLHRFRWNLLTSKAFLPHTKCLLVLTFTPLWPRCNSLACSHRRPPLTERSRSLFALQPLTFHFQDSGDEVATAAVTSSVGVASAAVTASRSAASSLFSAVSSSWFGQ